MNASKHIRTIILAALLGALAGCGGGGGNERADVVQPPPAPGDDTPPPTDTSTTLDWMLTPAAPDAAAAAEAAALGAGLGSLGFETGHSGSARGIRSGPKPTTPADWEHAHCCHKPGSIPATLSNSSYTQWSYWNHPVSTRHNIPMMQMVSFTYRGTERGLYGFTGGGAFYMGEGFFFTQFVGNANWEESAFGTGFAIYDLYHGGTQREIRRDFPVGATWVGGAFAMEKMTRTSMIGEAELVVDDVRDFLGGSSDSDEYRFTFTARFDTGRAEPVVLREKLVNTVSPRQHTSPGSYPFTLRKNGNNYDETPSYLRENPFYLEGSFSGTEAEHVLGVFEDNSYYGSFGLTKE